jgi:hypothetical protein
MYAENVFQQIAILISNQTYYLGWMVFFLLIMTITAVFKGNGIRYSLSQLREEQQKLHAQQSQMLHHLSQLQTIATAGYSTQYVAAKALEIRSAAAAVKRGDAEPAPAEILTPMDLQQQLAPKADETKPKEPPAPSPGFVNPYAR